MDWNLAIEKNREALRRMLAMLVAMVGVADGGSAGGQFAFFPRKDSDASGQAQAAESKLSPAPTCRAICIASCCGCCVRPRRRRGG